MVTVTQIEKILEKHPEGLKDRQIADILRVDKKNVNSILYQNKWKPFIQNDNYVWKIKGDKRASASSSVPNVDKVLTSNLPEKVQPVILDHISVIKCKECGLQL